MTFVATRRVSGLSVKNAFCPSNSWLRHWSVCLSVCLSLSVCLKSQDLIDLSDNVASASV